MDICLEPACVKSCFKDLTSNKQKDIVVVASSIFQWNEWIFSTTKKKRWNPKVKKGSPFPLNLGCCGWWMHFSPASHPVVLRKIQNVSNWAWNHRFNLKVLYFFRIAIVGWLTIVTVCGAIFVTFWYKISLELYSLLSWAEDRERELVFCGLCPFEAAAPHPDQDRWQCLYLILGCNRSSRCCVRREGCVGERIKLLHFEVHFVSGEQTKFPFLCIFFLQFFLNWIVTHLPWRLNNILTTVVLNFLKEIHFIFVYILLYDGGSKSWNLNHLL